MPRPKGSKNKSTLEREQEQPVEFDYDRDDGRFDMNYNPLSTTGSSTYASDVFVQPQETFAVDPRSVPSTSQYNEPKTRKMFLVEGEVQLNPTTPGRGAVVAKQFRLVMALDDNEAIAKYISYFMGLSDSESRYAVLSAAAMETIQ